MTSDKGSKNSVRADKNKKELIENSIKQFKKRYNNNPENTKECTLEVLNEILEEKALKINSKTPLQSFRNFKPVLIENFKVICEVLELRVKEVIDPSDLYKISTDPPYTPQTKTLKELESKKKYKKLIGRNAEKEEIKKHLSDLTYNQIIVVEGIGGAGKTSLVLESISEFCKLETNKEYAKNLIWLTAKSSEISGNQRKTLTPARISFKAVLNEVAVKLKQGSGIETRPNIEQKKDFLRGILGEKPYLIVIDNLETVENFRQLVRDLEDFFTYSKVLLTTRRSVEVSNHIHTINIEGFQDEKDSIEFIEQFLKSKPSAKKLIGDDTETLLSIHERTGGLPLAMELIISQIESGYLVDDVFEQLTEVDCKKLLERNSSDDEIFNQFYRFIYEQSWKLLTEEEKQILFDISAKPLATGLFLEDLQEDIPDKKLRRQSLKNLKQLNLIYYGKIDGMLSFFLHPLTHQFIKTK